MIFASALSEGGLQAIDAGRLSMDAASSVSQADQLRALGELTFTAYCSIVPIIMIISALPIAPAGWGVGEAAFAYFFATVGIAEQHAVALSFTLRITILLISLLGGLFLILDRKRVLEAAHEDPPPSWAPRPPPGESRELSHRFPGVETLFLVGC